ncbi:response regulator [Candidatus Nitrosotenuis aquarius]|uniref:response regulator n=1 Tax=Candidatus Nitrosotenuis aquarius TaxID=1846278 RepID=UPI000C1F86D8|nr:response regulator [Candidatus Nitrosotenuis aquarius]
MSQSLIIYIDDDQAITLALDNYFKSRKYEIEFLNEYDSDTFIKFLQEKKPRIIIVDDDLNGETHYAHIAQDVKRAFAGTDHKIHLIGCTGEETDLKSMKRNYKNEGYYDFLPNNGEPKQLDLICAVIDKIFTL